MRAGWAAGSPGERLRRVVKGHLRKWQFVVSYEFISLTALVFRAPRPPVDLNGSAPTAGHSRDTQPKACSAHWPGWEAKRGPDLGPLQVFVWVWALAAFRALPPNAGPGVQQWRRRGRRL